MANSKGMMSAAGNPQVVHMRRPRASMIAVIAILIAIASACVLYAFSSSGRGTPDTGSAIIPMGDMTQAQAQALLDEQTEQSRIHISIAPKPVLAEDGSLQVNLIVPEENNGYSERLVIEQDGQLVYESGAIRPGYALEWARDTKAHAGSATAIIWAVDANGDDHGNPVAVEIEITA